VKFQILTCKKINCFYMYFSCRWLSSTRTSTR